MKFKIETRQNKIYVTVTLKSAGTAGNPGTNRRVRLKDVVAELLKRKIKYGKCLKNPGLLSNFEGGPSLVKTWIFENFPKVHPHILAKQKKNNLDNEGEK